MELSLINIQSPSKQRFVVKLYSPEASVVAVIDECHHQLAAFTLVIVADSLVEPLGPFFRDQPAGRIRIKIEMKILAERRFGQLVIVSAGHHVKNQVTLVLLRVG
jgi:hypothetical protein